MIARGKMSKLLLIAAILSIAHIALGASTVDFVRDVQPIFASECYHCHGPQTQKASFRLDVREIAVKGGDDGPAIVPGHAQESLLFRYISGLDPKIRMPAKGDPLTAAQVETIRMWIDQGAAWPASASNVLADQFDFWSFKPLRNPAPPAVSNEAWVRTPIDRFILATLDSKGLHPAPRLTSEPCCAGFTLT